MRRLLISGLAFGLLLAPRSFAQSILPASLPRWHSTSSATATSANLSEIAGTLAPVLVEYGATGAESNIYARDGNAKRTFAATIYSFQDASGSYGAYTFIRTPGMVPANDSTYSVKSPDRVLVLAGSKLLDLSGAGVAHEEPAIQELVSLLAGEEKQAVYPALVMRLPATDLVRRTDHYFLGPVALGRFWPGTDAKGDWLGFSSGAEAETAKYRLKGREATLLVVDYPTPQIAATQMERMSKELRINAPRTTKGNLYARRDGSLVALMADAPSQAAANTVLDKIQSGVVVTWDAPAFKLHEPTMAAVVVGTIIGTGEICLFSIFGGVLFTLIRLGVKRMLPGKIFDRPHHFEILQMGLSSKPINAKDFY